MRQYEYSYYTGGNVNDNLWRGNHDEVYIRGEVLGMKRSKGIENVDETSSEALKIDFFTGRQYELNISAGGNVNDYLRRGNHDEVYIRSEAVGMNIEPKGR